MQEEDDPAGGVVVQMRHCPQPIIAAVDGVCAGAGAILAMAADLRLATIRARAAFLFVRVGLAEADALARELATGPTFAHAMSKKCLEQ